MSLFLRLGRRLKTFNPMSEPLLRHTWVVLRAASCVEFSAATCQLPVATASYHHWNFATIGTIQFTTASTVEHTL